MASRTIWGLAVVGALSGGCSFEGGSATSTGALGGDSEGDTEQTSGSSGDTPGATTGNSGSGSTDATDSDPTTGSDPTTDSDPTDSDPTDSDPTDSDPTGDETTTTGSADAAHLELSGDGFGSLAYEEQATAEFTVQNTGGEAATNVATSASGGFSVSANDCPGTLGPAESCTVTVRAPTSQLGPLVEELAVDYTNAGGDDVATLELTAEVTGSTGELVTDGGFESCDGDWITINGNWDCGVTDIDGIGPYAGSSYLAAATGPNNTIFTYRSNIDVSAFASAIETGKMMVDFSAFARAYGPGDDEHRIRVVYLDGGNDVLSTTGTSFQSFANWTEFAFDEALPVGTATVRINLQCEKTGGTYCDAYYDGVSLIGSYDGA